jgi:hypothetical protein
MASDNNLVTLITNMRARSLALGRKAHCYPCSFVHSQMTALVHFEKAQSGFGRNWFLLSGKYFLRRLEWV